MRQLQFIDSYNLSTALYKLVANLEELPIAAKCTRI